MRTKGTSEIRRTLTTHLPKLGARTMVLYPDPDGVETMKRSNRPGPPSPLSPDPQIPLLNPVRTRSEIVTSSHEVRRRNRNMEKNDNLLILRFPSLYYGLPLSPDFDVNKTQRLVSSLSETNVQWSHLQVNPDAIFVQLYVKGLYEGDNQQLFEKFDYSFSPNVGRDGKGSLFIDPYQ